MSLTEQAFEILEQIESVSSTNAKKELISENIDNNILFNLFYWTYNPFLHFYMNKIDLFEVVPDKRKNGKSEYPKHMVEFKRILSRLNARKETGNSARDMVQNFLKTCDSLEIKWYLRVISRDLRCGVSVTTINNMYGNVIPTYPVALAETPDVRVYPPNFRIDDKFDGYRCLTEKCTNQTQMYSRNGNDLLGYDELLYLIDTCGPEKEVVLDGELISSDFKGTQNNAFRKTNGKRANYYVFDIMPRTNFYDEDGFDDLWQRQKLLNAYISLLKEKAKKLKLDTSCIVEVIPIVTYYHGILTLREDFAKAYKHRLKYVNPTQSLVEQICDEAYANALERGLEGVIVKDLDSLYMVGKSYSSECADVKRKNEKWYSWAKRKPHDTIDLVVQDVYEGTGQNEGKLGGVHVLYEASDGNEYLVGVGSGFKANHREEFWENPNLIVGKTIEIEYDIETQDKDGNYSLRFPRFKKIRKDK